MDGKLVRYWREKRGLTQEQLAKEVGVSRPTITQVENGVHGLTEDNRRRLVDALDLTMAEFYRAETKVAEAG